MNIKSLLLGSAAALVAVSGARAADAVVIAEPEPMEYVRVCDVYGTGYYYIPGTETCLHIGGRVRFDINAASSYALNSDNGWRTRSRAEIYMDSASETEYGTLKTNAVFRFDFDGDYNDGAHTNTSLIAANITLGGLLVGLADSNYTTFTGYAGDIINDDVVSYGEFEVNQIQYSFNAGGFTGIVSLEDDSLDDENYMVDVVGGIGFTVGDFGIKVVGGYDESAEEGGIKGRLDAKFGAVSAFVMAAYNTDGNTTNKFAPAGVAGIGWGDWALWAGLGTQFSDTLGGNVQVAYTDNETLAIAANLKWYPVQNLLIMPEVTYTKVDDVLLGSTDDDTWNAMVRFQRTF
jgi:hypothetical protein